MVTPDIEFRSEGSFLRSELFICFVHWSTPKCLEEYLENCRYSMCIAEWLHSWKIPAHILLTNILYCLTSIFALHSIACHSLPPFFRWKQNSGLLQPAVESYVSAYILLEECSSGQEVVSLGLFISLSLSPSLPPCLCFLFPPTKILWVPAIWAEHWRFLVNKTNIASVLMQIIG